MNICEKKTRDLDDLIDDPNAFQELVRDQEWTILNSTKGSKKTKRRKSQGLHINQLSIITPIILNHPRGSKS